MRKQDTSSNLQFSHAFHHHYKGFIRWGDYWKAVSNSFSLFCKWILKNRIIRVKTYAAYPHLYTSSKREGFNPTLAHVSGSRFDIETRKFRRSVIRDSSFIAVFCIGNDKRSESRFVPKHAASKVGRIIGKWKNVNRKMFSWLCVGQFFSNRSPPKTFSPEPMDHYVWHKIQLVLWKNYCDCSYI